LEDKKKIRKLLGVNCEKHGKRGYITLGELSLDGKKLEWNSNYCLKCCNEALVKVGLKSLALVERE